MTIHKQRALVGRVATLAMAAGGAVAGYLLGCVLAIQLAENWLNQYSKLVVAQEDASSMEAHSLLATLNKSTRPFCSDAEIEYFRDLVFRSEYVKDAGRIHGGRIECSATEGHPARLLKQFTPEAAQPDGTIAYSNLVPIEDSSLKRAGLQQGSAYVVLGSHVPATLGPIPMHLTFGMSGVASLQSGNPREAASERKEIYLTAEGTFRQGDTLYGTSCSTGESKCVAASTSVPEAMQGERGIVAGGTFLGGVLGALLGAAFSLIRRRSRTSEQQLRRAIAREKLDVVYQPIVCMSTGRIMGAEALARWKDDDGNAVSPDVFIKTAEEHGFVGTVTKLVIKRAMQSFAMTLRNRPGFRLSVNVAAADLADPEFLPMLDETLKKSKVAPKSVVIEITESSTANRVVAMETIRELRRRGHSIHIDDFGTGYSSLSYLLYLSVDTIKIDKAFTRVIGTEAVTVAILPQILAMARSLQLDVVVEGVENERQANYFSTEGQRIYGQGWLYGKPVSAGEFLGVLADDMERGPVPAMPERARAPEPMGVRSAEPDGYELVPRLIA
jgi:sensor c-di-GMP phosphodiesterase-like protein